MKKNLRRLVLLALALSLNAFGEPAKVDIVRTDWYKISIDGETQDENYATYHTATEAALNAWLACDYCQVMILQPAISVDGTKAIVPVPLPVPIDPVDPEPEPDPVPEPEPVPVAYFSYALDAEDQLVSPLPLDGASLLPQVIYVEWRGGEFDHAKVWCCKLPNGTHREVMKGLQFRIDLRELPVSAELYEMYSDVFLTSQKYLWGNFAKFTIRAVDPTPIDPGGTDPLPVPDPDPDPELIEVTVDWTAPTHRENGDALAAGELKGYTASYKQCDASLWVQVFIEGEAVDNWTVALPEGCYNFRINAIDTGKLVSQWSDTINIDTTETTP